MGAAGRGLDGFVAAVGTAGTLMGVGRVVRGANPAAAVARVVVAGETVDAEQGGPACLGIPGVVDCMSGLLDEDELGGHPPLAVPRAEAMEAARELARRGFPVGPSSGLNLAGARRLALTLGPGHHVATVACDRMERYFSTDLFDDLRDALTERAGRSPPARYRTTTAVTSRRTSSTAIRGSAGGDEAMDERLDRGDHHAGGHLVLVREVRRRPAGEQLRGDVRPRRPPAPAARRAARAGAGASSNSTWCRAGSPAWTPTNGVDDARTRPARSSAGRWRACSTAARTASVPSVTWARTRVTRMASLLGKYW